MIDLFDPNAKPGEWLIGAAVLIGLMVVFLLPGWILSCRSRRPRRRKPRDGLDTPLFAWTKQDDLTLKGLLDGGIFICGRPGSGKSSSSSFQLLRAIAAYPRSGGLILSASPSDLALVKRAFAGRQNRLVVFDERTNYRFNAVNFILECGGSSKDVLMGLMAIAETVVRGGGGQAGGDEGSFFSVGAKRILGNAIIIVRHATGGVSPADLLTFINGAASSVEEFHSEKFAETLHYRYLKTAHERDKPEAEEFDCDKARAYFMSEHLKLADRTRSSLIAVVMNTLDIFNSGMNRLLFATGSNISPKLMDQGKFIFINQPISRCGEEGAFALGVWKFMTEWYVMRRDTEQDHPPMIIHADEFHNTINAFDTRFLGEGRKFGGCMIACTQSISSFYANMAGQAAEAQVDALLNNFSHKIIHALGDSKTASWASELVGSAMQFNLGGTEQSPGTLRDAWIGRGVWSGSLTEQVRPLIEPREFMHGFRTGGAANNFLCDAVVIRSGEPFASNGENFLWRAFRQR